jgi:hypothetical protein
VSAAISKDCFLPFDKLRVLAMTSNVQSSNPWFLELGIWGFSSVPVDLLTLTNIIPHEGNDTGKTTTFGKTPFENG